MLCLYYSVSMEYIQLPIDYLPPATIGYLFLFLGLHYTYLTLWNTIIPYTSLKFKCSREKYLLEVQHSDWLYLFYITTFLTDISTIIYWPTILTVWLLLFIILPSDVTYPGNTYLPSDGYSTIRPDRREVHYYISVVCLFYSILCRDDWLDDLWLSVSMSI